MRVSAPPKNNQHLTNKTSFKAKLMVSDSAKEVLKKELISFHSQCNFFQKLRFFGLKKFNFEEILKNYKSSIESATQNIKGEIMLIMGLGANSPKNKPEILFKPEGCISALKSSKRGEISERSAITISATDILPDKLFSEKNPMKHAIMLTEFKLSNLFNMNNRELNPFEELFNSKFAS